jgi:hypothetical protein
LLPLTLRDRVHPPAGRTGSRSVLALTLSISRLALNAAFSHAFYIIVCVPMSSGRPDGNFLPRAVVSRMDCRPSCRVTYLVRWEAGRASAVGLGQRVHMAWRTLTLPSTLTGDPGQRCCWTLQIPMPHLQPPTSQRSQNAIIEPIKSPHLRAFQAVQSRPVAPPAVAITDYDSEKEM